MLIKRRWKTPCGPSIQQMYELLSLFFHSSFFLSLSCSHPYSTSHQVCAFVCVLYVYVRVCVCFFVAIIIIIIIIIAVVVVVVVVVVVEDVVVV